MSQDNVVIEVLQLKKIYKDFWGRPKAFGLDGIDFTVNQGEVFGLLGPNGSGKTTTLKLLLGLLNPTHGNITLFGGNPGNVRTKKRIGYLPENSYLYPHLTAKETLKFFGALFGLSKSEVLRRSEELINMVGLSHVPHRKIGEYSKGMARRLGLAQALINDPELVILDEPTAGLDPIGCRDVKNLIRLLVSRKKTVIISSHLLADMEDVCDRVAILYAGKIRASGTVETLLEVKDGIRISIDAIENKQLTSIKTSISELIPDSRIRVDKPRVKLEQFFHDVVNRTQERRNPVHESEIDTPFAQYLVHGEIEGDKKSEPVYEDTDDKKSTGYQRDGTTDTTLKQPDRQRLEQLITSAQNNRDASTD